MATMIPHFCCCVKVESCRPLTSQLLNFSDSTFFAFDALIN